MHRNCGLWKWMCMDVVVWENYSLEELWCERVAVLGSCGVCDLQCMAVAAYKSYYLWELWCVSCGMGCVKEWSCRGVVLCVVTKP